MPKMKGGLMTQEYSVFNAAFDTKHFVYSLSSSDCVPLATGPNEARPECPRVQGSLDRLSIAATCDYGGSLLLLVARQPMRRSSPAGE